MQVYINFMRFFHMYFQIADTMEERRSHWTCYICKGKAPLHSLDSLESQEKSKKTEIFVYGNYRYVIHGFMHVMIEVNVH